MKKHSMIVAILFLSALVLTGCGTDRTAKTGVPESGKEAVGQAEPDAETPAGENPADAPAAEDPSASGNQVDSLQTNQGQPMTIDTAKKYTAVLKTDAGDITIALSADKTPITVNNFVNLSKKNFYDNTIFHRVIKDFMIQGGDPKGDGTGGPGYKFEDEPFEGEYVRGTVAMANAGPDTNGSQFFIMHKDVALPKNYVIFGTITEGMDAVDKIAEAETEMSASGEKSKPVVPVKISSVVINEE